MSDELEDNLVAEIRPVFPQLSDSLKRIGTRVVRENNVDADHTVTGLLPSCIDYLLDIPQEIDDKYVRGHAADRENENNGVRYQLKNVNNEGICAQKHSTDFGGNSFDNHINGCSFDSKMRNIVGHTRSSSSSSASSSSSHSPFSSDCSEVTTDEHTKQSNDLDCFRIIKSNSNETLNGFQDEDTSIVYQVDPFEEACKIVVSRLSTSFNDFKISRMLANFL